MSLNLIILIFPYLDHSGLGSSADCCWVSSRVRCKAGHKEQQWVEGCEAIEETEQEEKDEGKEKNEQDEEEEEG